jgi:serine/threonine protein kinase
MQMPSRIGRYLIVGVSGQWTVGSQTVGWLYHGQGDADGRDVLIKTLPSPEGEYESAFRARFEQEAKATAVQKHPNIVTLYELGMHGDTPFLVFEWLKGRSLREAMNAGISLKVGLPALVQVLDALAYVHKTGIIHRNINPGCIFVCNDGLAKITDFFLAGLVHPTTIGSSMVAALAVPFYLSPELATGTAFDSRADLFSVGSVLYEMVTGRKPFDDSSKVGVLFKILTQEPDLGPIPDGPEWKQLRSVITRALQKKPQDRYPDAAAMRDDLGAALKELGDSADWAPPPSGEPTDPH